MIKMISAVSKNGIIGSKNDLPWPKDKYPEDMKFFRRMTANTTIICGRKTFESFGSRPLPKRRNVVITRQPHIEGVECSSSLKSFFDAEKLKDQAQDYWIIGGENIYRSGMEYTSEIYLTLIPEVVEGESLVSFPWINPEMFMITDTFSLENSDLKVVKYCEGSARRI